MRAFLQRIARAWRAFRMAWNGEPIVTRDTVSDDAPVEEPVVGPKNVRAVRKVDGLDVLLYHGRDKANGRRACEHAVSLLVAAGVPVGQRAVTFTVDGADRTPPEWR